MKLTELSPEEQGKLIHEYRTTLENAFKVVDNAWLTIGEKWDEMVENKVWLIWGNDAVKNANTLAKDLNLGSRSKLDHYKRLAKMFGKYIRSEGLNPRLWKLLPVHALINSMKFNSHEEKEEAVIEWLYKADTLSFEALNNEIGRIKGKKYLTDNCPHATIIHKRKCKDCGKVLEYEEKSVSNMP